MVWAQRAGICHTGQGWNVGKPPYGYLAERHKPPCPRSRRSASTRPSWRSASPQSHRGADVRLAHRRVPVVPAIAERLNTDLDRYPHRSRSTRNVRSAGGPAPPCGRSCSTRSTPDTWCGTGGPRRTSSTQARTTPARSGSSYLGCGRRTKFRACALQQRVNPRVPVREVILQLGVVELVHGADGTQPPQPVRVVQERHDVHVGAAVAFACHHVGTR